MTSTSTRLIQFFKLSGLMIAFGTSAVRADPIQWSGNGHWYEVVVSTGISWEDAQAAAIARGGYLATVTTNAENALVYSLADAAPDAWSVIAGSPFGEVSGPWLGGYQPESSPEPFDNWNWTNGEGSFNTPGYNTNWISASPNNFGGNENRIQYFGLNLQRSALWNDRNDGTLLQGYAIEWTTAPVPEPGTVALMLAGVGALGFVARRRT